MILQRLHLLTTDPVLFLVLTGLTAAAVVIAITVHEFSHALVATRLGDSTARSLGRLSFNPLAHLEPLGTILFFLAGFGWGRPVPVNPLHLRGDVRTGMALVSVAGPAANLLLVLLLSVTLLRTQVLAWHSPWSYRPLLELSLPWIAADVVGYVVGINIALAVFNLIPVSPLDGFKVLVGLLPRDAAAAFARTEAYGPGLLMLVIGADYFFGVNILGRFLTPAIDFIMRLAVGRGA